MTSAESLNFNHARMKNEGYHGGKVQTSQEVARGVMPILAFFSMFAFLCAFLSL